MKTLLAVAVLLGLSVAAACVAPGEIAGALMILANTAPVIVPPMKRLTTQDMLERFGYRSRATLRTRMKTPGFPQPIKDDGSPVNFWIEGEVNEYIQRQAEARDRARQLAQQAQTVAA